MPIPQPAVTRLKILALVTNQALYLVVTAGLFGLKANRHLTEAKHQDQTAWVQNQTLCPFDALFQPNY